MKEINNEISQGTNMKPVERLKKETKYLNLYQIVKY